MVIGILAAACGQDPTATPVPTSTTAPTIAPTTTPAPPTPTPDRDASRDAYFALDRLLDIQIEIAVCGHSIQPGYLTMCIRSSIWFNMVASTPFNEMFPPHSWPPSLALMCATVMSWPFHHIRKAIKVSRLRVRGLPTGVT